MPEVVRPNDRGRRGASGAVASPASSHALADFAPDHEGAEGTPKPPDQWKSQQDQGPPPGPEQVESGVGLAFLRSKL